MHEFHGFPAPVSDWRLTRMLDRRGNHVNVRYPSAGEWQLIDSLGRTQSIFLSDGRVTRVELTAFNQSTAVINFTYTPTVIERQRFAPPSCATESSHVTVDLLTRVTLPDGSFYEMDYYTSDSYPEYLSGGLKELRFPTGGKYRWTYQWLDFIRRDPPFSDLDWSRIAFGVAKKEIFEDADDAAPIGTWEYDFVSVGNPPLPPDDTVPCYHTVTVKDASGNESVNYFATSNTLHQWTYGLPMTRCNPHAGGAEYPDEGPFLSQEIYQGSAATGTKLRAVWVDYESDGREYGTVVGKNHRLRRRLVVYHDDGDRVKEETWSGFTGLGTHRTAVANNDYGDGATRTVETSYHPEYGEYLIDPETMEE
ncbi:MAG: hypothetical protein GY856_23175, partial [bacterium]|nr:hypothetical protein [bacterium]